MVPLLLELVIEVKSSDPGDKISFFLRQTGDSTVTGATVSPVSSDLDLIITTADGATKVDLPSAGRAVPMVVAVSGLSQAVDSRVDLYVQTDDGTVQTLGVLRVLRTDAPALSVVGDSGSGLTFEQDREDFSRELLLRSDTGADVQATLTFTPWQDNSSQQVPLGVVIGDQVILNGSGLDVPARETRTLTVTGALPRASTYRAILTFTYGPQSASRLTVPLTVTRTATAQTVVAETVDPVHDTRPFCLSVFSCTDKDGATAEVAFRETAGVEAGFDPLQVLRVRVDDAGTMVQADDLTATVSRLGDDEPVASVVDEEDGESASMSLPIGARESVVVEAQLAAIDRAGKYEIVLRGTTPGAQPVDVTATILVRDAVWYAVLVILAGGLLSWALRQWIGHGRASFGVRVDLATVREDIDSIVRSRRPAPARRNAIDQLRGLLRRVSAGTDSGNVWDPQAAVKGLKKRVQLLDEWLEVCGLADTSGTNPDIEKLLATARDTLVRDAMLDDSAASVITGSMREARFLVDRAAAEKRRDEVDKILAQVNPPVGFDQAAWDALRLPSEKLLLAAGERSSSAALAESDRVLRVLIGELASRLAETLEEKARSHRAQHVELADKLEKLAEEVRWAERQASASLLDALATYRAAHTEYERLAKEMADIGVQMNDQGQKPLVLSEHPEVLPNPIATSSDRSASARSHPPDCRCHRVSGDRPPDDAPGGARAVQEQPDLGLGDGLADRIPVGDGSLPGWRRRLGGHPEHLEQVPRGLTCLNTSTTDASSGSGSRRRKRVLRRSGSGGTEPRSTLGRCASAARPSGCRRR